MSNLTTMADFTFPYVHANTAVNLAIPTTSINFTSFSHLTLHGGPRPTDFYSIFPLDYYIGSLVPELTHTVYTTHTSLPDKADQPTGTPAAILRKRQLKPPTIYDQTVTKTVYDTDWDWINDDFDSSINYSAFASYYPTIRPYSGSLPTGPPPRDYWHTGNHNAAAQSSTVTPSSFVTVTRPASAPVSAAPESASPAPSVSASLPITGSVKNLAKRDVNGHRKVTETVTVVYPPRPTAVNTQSKTVTLGGCLWDDISLCDKH